MLKILGKNIYTTVLWSAIIVPKAITKVNNMSFKLQQTCDGQSSCCLSFACVQATTTGLRHRGLYRGWQSGSPPLCKLSSSTQASSKLSFKAVTTLKWSWIQSFSTPCQLLPTATTYYITVRHEKLLYYSSKHSKFT